MIFKWMLVVALFALALAVAWFVFPPPPARASTLCVNPGGTGGCYAAIQDAIDAAAPGDTITIATGVYTVPGPNGQIYISKNNLTIQGSGLGTVVTPSLRSAAQNTVISNLVSRHTATVVGDAGIRNDGDLTLIDVLTEGDAWGVYTYGGTVNAMRVSLYSSSGLVCNMYATVNITNSVLTTLGGWHPGYCGNITLTNDTFIGGAGGLGTITATNTIFGGGCPPIHSLGHNIDVGNTCGLNAPGDMTNTNPLLTPPVTINGTVPNALYPTSPARDAGDDGKCPAADITGFRRPYGSHCDIGAYEWRPNAFFLSFFPFIDR